MMSPTRAPERKIALPVGNGANHDDVGEYSSGRLRGVAAGEGDGISPRQLQKSGQEFIDPALRQLGGKRERKKRGARNASHGSDVAQSAGEAAVADGVGGMPLAAKVNVLEREVGGDQHFVSARDVEDGAVVANAMAGFLAASGGGSPNSLDEFEFFCGHRWLQRGVRRLREKRQPTISL